MTRRLFSILIAPLVLLPLYVPLTIIAAESKYDINLGIYITGVFVSFFLISSVIKSQYNIGYILVHWYLLYFLLCPLAVQLSTGSYFYSYLKFSDADSMFFVVIISVFIMFFEIGYRLQKSVPRKSTQEISPNAVISFSILVFLYSLFSIWKVGLSLFLSSRVHIDTMWDAMGDISSATKLLYVDTPRTGALLAFFLLTYFLIKSNHNINKLVLLFCIAFIAPIAIITNYPLSIYRFYLFAILFIFSALFLKYTQLTKIIFIVMISFAMYILSPMISYLTRGKGNQTLESFLQVNSDMFSKLQYDGGQMIMLAIRHIDESGYYYGQQLIGAIFTFIPRIVWENKPISSGAAIGEAMGFSFTNISMPLPGEFYINFGVLGVALLSFFWGRLIKLAEFLVYRSGGFLTITGLLAICFIAWIPFYSRGSLNDAQGKFLSFIVWIFILAILTAKQSYIKGSVNRIIQVSVLEDVRKIR